MIGGNEDVSLERLIYLIPTGTHLNRYAMTLNEHLRGFSRFVQTSETVCRTGNLRTTDTYNYTISANRYVKIKPIPCQFIRMERMLSSLLNFVIERAVWGSVLAFPRWGGIDLPDNSMHRRYKSSTASPLSGARTTVFHGVLYRPWNCNDPPWVSQKR